MADHALLIGTTGMLAGAARQIVGESQHATLCARGAGHFSFGEPFLDEKVMRLPLDYTDETHFLDTLAIRGPVDLALTWLHPKAESLRDGIAERVIPGGKVIEVLGSATGRPGGFADERLAAMEAAHAGKTYRQVVLGFVAEPDGTSRWLTHEEICAAVLAAYRGFETRTVAGTLEPWDKRPG
jgi:ribosomal protein S28E/S33